VNVLICDLKTANTPRGGDPPGWEGKKSTKCGWILITIHFSALGVCARIRENDLICEIKRRRYQSTSNQFIKSFKNKFKKLFNTVVKYEDDDRHDGSQKDENSTLLKQISQFFLTIVNLGKIIVKLIKESYRNKLNKKGTNTNRSNTEVNNENNSKITCPDENNFNSTKQDVVRKKENYHLNEINKTVIKSKTVIVNKENKELFN